MTLHLHVCLPAAVQLAKITTLWSWQQEWIPMCSVIRFQNHEVVRFYRAALWRRSFMRPLVQQLTLPGRRSIFYPTPAPHPPPPTPIKMAGIPTLKFLSAPFEKWNANGLFCVGALEEKSEPLGCGRKVERSRIVKQRRSPSPSCY